MPPVPAPAVSADGEVASWRTAQSRTYLDTAGGGYRTVLYGSPVNHTDAAGVWQKDDLTVRPGRSTSAAAPVAVPTDPGAGPVSVTGPGGAIGLQLLGAAASATGREAGAGWSWPAVLPGVTQSVQATGP